MLHHDVAFASLGYVPEESLLDDIAAKAVSIMGSFTPQAVANTLWAFAKLGCTPLPSLLHAIAFQMLQNLPKSVPQVQILPPSFSPL